MATRTELGLFFLGHPTTLDRIIYILCSPKPRFTPELNDEFSEYNVSEFYLPSFRKFIEKGGADIFRNSINRQKFIPVTQADIEQFLFSHGPQYAENTEPWTSSQVNFCNLFGLCILTEEEYRNSLSDGLDWRSIDHGVYRVSRIQNSEENLQNNDAEEIRSSHDSIFENPPVCRKLNLLKVNSSVGYEQKVLHLCFEQDSEYVAFPLSKVSRLATRFGTRILFYFRDYWNGEVDWFYTDGSRVEQTETDGLAIKKLNEIGFEERFCRLAFALGPQEKVKNVYDIEYDNFDPIAHAISHVEQSRD